MRLTRFAADVLRAIAKSRMTRLSMDSQLPTDKASAPVPLEILQQLPEKVRGSYQRYLEHGDLEAADEVVLAIVVDHVPSKKVSQIPAQLTDSSTLMGDLGIDSVSISDAVFVIEDVFDISITNQELVRIRTVGDLRSFIRSKHGNGKAN